MIIYVQQPFVITKSKFECHICKITQTIDIETNRRYFIPLGWYLCTRMDTLGFGTAEYTCGKCHTAL